MNGASRELFLCYKSFKKYFKKVKKESFKKIFVKASARHVWNNSKKKSGVKCVKMLCLEYRVKKCAQDTYIVSEDVFKNLAVEDAATRRLFSNRRRTTRGNFSSDFQCYSVVSAM